ncbi:hypothetical protein LguiB_026476 [Lonicera macranthoides]
MGQSEGPQGCEHVTTKFHIQKKKEVHNNNRLARSIFEEKALKKHITSNRRCGFATGGDVSRSAEGFGVFDDCSE